MFGPATIPAMIAAGIDMQQETYTINVSRLFQFGTAAASSIIWAIKQRPNVSPCKMAVRYGI